MDLNDYRLKAYLKSNGKNTENNSQDSRIKKPVFEKIQRTPVNPLQDKLQENNNKAFKAESKVQPVSFSQFAPQEKTKAKSFDDEAKKAASLLTSGGLVKVTGATKPDGTDSIYRRVAKFFLIIGVDEAAKILPHLTQEQTEKIIPEIASIRNVSSEEAITILAEFQSLVQRAKEGGGIETAKTILSKAFGEKRASELLEKTVKFGEEKPFAYLNELENDKVILLLKDELPAIQALVLSNLKPQKAASIINVMDSETKTEIVRRLAKMTPIAPDVLQRVNQTMKEKLNSIDTTSSNQIDGRASLVQILKKLDVQAENDILNNLSEEDPELGQALKKDLFTLEDIINCDDRYLQNELSSMEAGDIALLIAAKNDDFRKKILSNVSKTRGDIILEEEQLRKPMLRSDCEKITSQFMGRMRKAFEEGKYIIKGRTDDIYI
ncbi:MAG: flagellar motor switch protein FliG [Treponema sp.]|nr:flagellar motor switch protein FliG [Treponema sp.]